MGGNLKKLKVAILNYPDVRPSVVHGLADLFNVANNANGREIVSVHHVSRLSGRYDLVIVPPGHHAWEVEESPTQLRSMLKTQYDYGATVCSICSGAVLLADAGLLSGRIATTHWTFAEAFLNRYPDVNLDMTRVVVDDGDIITAGGIMAWTDLGLWIIRRWFGAELMHDVARFMLLDPPRDEQRFYQMFKPNLGHGDQEILKTQIWLGKKFGKDASISLMARRAGLEERTFLRRFAKATGMRPTEYSQQLRIAKARETLELTNHKLERIASSVGYEDINAFRKVFIKITGISPAEYRKKFYVSTGDFSGKA